MCQASNQAVTNAVHHFIDKANEIFSLGMDYPTIAFDVKGGNGGTAHSPKWHLRFNAILMQDNMAEYINQVAPHEVAHLVTYKLNGDNYEYKRTRRGQQRVSHGKRFYSVMRAFGVDESRCHSMDVSKVAKKRNVKSFGVLCTGCGESFTVGTVRKNKIERGAIYRHRCGGGRTPSQIILT